MAIDLQKLKAVISAAGLLATEKAWAIVAGWIGVSIFTPLAIVSIVMVVWSVLDSTHKTSWDVAQEPNTAL